MCSSNSVDKWICDACSPLPFTSILSMVMPRLIASSVTAPSTSANKKACSVCKRTVPLSKSNKVLVCNSCNHWVHRKCSAIQLTVLNSLSKKRI